MLPPLYLVLLSAPNFLSFPYLIFGVPASLANSLPFCLFILLSLLSLPFVPFATLFPVLLRYIF
jgi:hypothetical protein